MCFSRVIRELVAIEGSSSVRHSVKGMPFGLLLLTSMSLESPVRRALAIPSVSWSYCAGASVRLTLFGVLKGVTYRSNSAGQLEGACETLEALVELVPLEVVFWQENVVDLCRCFHPMSSVPGVVEQDRAVITILHLSAQMKSCIIVRSTEVDSEKTFSLKKLGEQIAVWAHDLDWRYCVWVSWKLFEEVGWQIGDIVQLESG